MNRKERLFSLVRRDSPIAAYIRHAQRGSGSAHPGSLEERLMEMESKLSQVCFLLMLGYTVSRR